MGVFDKLKNALFEVEYVEVEEKPKKEKKDRHILKKEKEKKKVEEKPIAKKIVLPKKEDKIEQLEEEDLKDEDFEIRPKDETVKEEKNSFKFMDDEDFEVVDEPRIVEAFDVNENNEIIEPKVENDYEMLKEERQDVHSRPYESEDNLHRNEFKPSRESKPYGVDNSYKLNVHEYGTYEKKDERVYFKPSPIISPIYGILDKNYRKEDVVSKKDIRITSNYSRTNVDVDDIRNKAFGRRGNRKEAPIEEGNTFEVDESEDNLLVDLTDEKDKPEVKQVTVGDAMEYFQDLGLEYNVDYVDASKEKAQSKNNAEEKVDTPKKEEKVEKVEKKEKSEVLEEKKAEKKAEKEEKTNVVEVKDESKKKTTPELDDDNLFDLIDSMYSDDN